MPESHDGNFTFELRFSEEVDLISTTLRDHSFTVTGGMVAKARRLTPPSNIGWEIHVTPDGDEAVTIRLPVTTDCNAKGAICTGDCRPLSNRLDVTVPGPPSQQASQENSPATGAPTISGTAQVGETLTASTSGIADEDGLDDASFSYQWVRNDGNADTDIVGETSSTYTMGTDDLGKTVKVGVSFTDDAGNEESLNSAATWAVAARTSQPLTASLENTPAGHNGTGAFTILVESHFPLQPPPETPSPTHRPLITVSLGLGQTTVPAFMSRETSVQLL